MAVEKNEQSPNALADIAIHHLVRLALLRHLAGLRARA